MKKEELIKDIEVSESFKFLKENLKEEEFYQTKKEIDDLINDWYANIINPLNNILGKIDT